MKDCAVRYERNGGSHIVGKVVSLGRSQIFFRARDKDLLRAHNAFSIPPEVLTLLEDEGVAEIHVLYQPERQIYAIDTESVRHNGLLESMSPKIGLRWHVPREHFSRRPLTYRPPFLTREIVVTATSGISSWTSSTSWRLPAPSRDVSKRTSVTQLRFEWIETSGNRDLKAQAGEAARSLGAMIGLES